MSYTEKKNNRKAKLPEEKQSPATIKKVIRPKRDEVSLELKLEQPHVRYLKLHRLYRQLQWEESVVPELRLNGRWLERAGFNIEKYVSVTIMEGLLIIKPATGLGNG